MVAPPVASRDAGAWVNGGTTPLDDWSDGPVARHPPRTKLLAAASVEWLASATFGKESVKRRSKSGVREVLPRTWVVDLVALACLRRGVLRGPLRCVRRSGVRGAGRSSPWGVPGLRGNEGDKHAHNDISNIEGGMAGNKPTTRHTQMALHLSGDVCSLRQMERRTPQAIPTCTQSSARLRAAVADNGTGLVHLEEHSSRQQTYRFFGLTAHAAEMANDIIRERIWRTIHRNNRRE